MVMQRRKEQASEHTTLAITTQSDPEGREMSRRRSASDANHCWSVGLCDLALLLLLIHLVSSCRNSATPAVLVRSAWRWLRSPAYRRIAAGNGLPDCASARAAGGLASTI